MKTYLKNFFERCEYAKEDTAFLIGTYEKIMRNEEASALWDQAVTIYEENICCNFRRVLLLADQAAELLSIHK